MVEEIRAHKEEYMELKKVERGMKRLESFDHSALMKDLFQLFSSPVMEELASRALCGDLQTLSCRSALFCAVTINHRMLRPSSEQKFWKWDALNCQIRHKLFFLPKCTCVLAELNISFHLM